MVCFSLRINNRRCQIAHAWSDNVITQTAKGCFGFWVKLSPAHLFTTLGETFTLFLLTLNVKQGICEYQFFWFLVWPDRESNQSLPFQQQVLYDLNHWSANELSGSYCQRSKFPIEQVRIGWPLPHKGWCDASCGFKELYFRNLPFFNENKR